MAFSCLSWKWPRYLATCGELMSFMMPIYSLAYSSLRSVRTIFFSTTSELLWERMHILERGLP